MFTILEPTKAMIETMRARCGREDFSYDFTGATREPIQALPGYDRDHNRIRLGKGESDFTSACAALRRWEMFNLGWVEATDSALLIQPGTTVIVKARCFGLWWLNACRIVYLVDETGPVRKFGFAYGTLPCHVERGEERFVIEWDHADDSVWYDIYAVSQPAYWMVKLGYPLARRLQRKFARDSKQAMLLAVEDHKFRAETITA